MAATPRIAVVGGDERGGRVEWPRGYDVRHFQTDKSSGKLDAALASGKYKMVILMTKWIGHDVGLARKFSVPTRYWDRGFSELVAALPEFLPPGDEAAAASGDDKWYERAEEGPVPEPIPAPTITIAATPKAAIKIEDAMRRLQRDFELLADGLLEDADVLVMVEKLLQRGIVR